jgi:hypothetical protein
VRLEGAHHLEQTKEECVDPKRLPLFDVALKEAYLMLMVIERGFLA